MKLIPLILLPVASWAFVPRGDGRLGGCCVPSVTATTQPRSLALQATKQATFGAGCFWKPAEEMLKADGVIDTVAGYTGKPDATKAPNYDQVCFSRDWIEGVRVSYDDSKLSYTELLDIFFEAQEPKVGSRQYGSFIFPHDAEQEKAAKEWIATSAENNRRREDGITPRFSVIEPLSKFYQAEGYHQRYWEKQRPRFAGIFVLLMVSTGIFDQFIPMEYARDVQTFGSAAAIVLGLYQVLERQIDNKVVEL